MEMYLVAENTSLSVYLLFFSKAKALCLAVVGPKKNLLVCKIILGVIL